MTIDTRSALAATFINFSLAVLWIASILCGYVSVRAYRVSGSVAMRNRNTFLVAGLLVVAAVIYLIVSSTGTTAQFFVTVAELQAMGEEALGRNITVSGAVLGETIVYDAMLPQVTFTIVEVPADPDEVEAAGGRRKYSTTPRGPPVSARDRVQQRETGSTHERGTSHRPRHPGRGWPFCSR